MTHFISPQRTKQGTWTRTRKSGRRHRSLSGPLFFCVMRDLWTKRMAFWRARLGAPLVSGAKIHRFLDSSSCAKTQTLHVSSNKTVDGETSTKNRRRDPSSFTSGGGNACYRSVSRRKRAKYVVRRSFRKEASAITTTSEPL